MPHSGLRQRHLPSSMQCPLPEQRPQANVLPRLPSRTAATPAPPSLAASAHVAAVAATLSWLWLSAPGTRHTSSAAARLPLPLWQGVPGLAWRSGGQSGEPPLQTSGESQALVGARQTTP